MNNKPNRWNAARDAHDAALRARASRYAVYNGRQVNVRCYTPGQITKFVGGLLFAAYVIGGLI